MSGSTEISANSPQTALRAQRLAYIGYGGLTVGAAWYWFNSPWPDPTLNLLAILICAMGIIPMLRWLQHNDPSYPLLEILQLTIVPFYAIPLITEHEEVARYSQSILISSSWLVLLFQLLCSFGGYVASQRQLAESRRVWWKDELIGDQNLKFTSFTLTLTTLWLFVSTFTHWVPRELIGASRAIFFGIGIISGFIQARLWGNHQLNQSQRVAFAVNIFLQVMLANLSLLLVTSLITLLLIMVGYFSSARRIPWAVCLVALPVFALLHSGKYKMREIYWGENGHDVSVLEVPAFYGEWFQYGWEKSLKGMDKDEPNRHSSLFERASLMQIVCYTIDTVPDRSPYLNGETYAYIPPQFFPRFIWPNKPSPNDSVKTLSVRLGMLSEEQAETTSIGYGLIAEAYANFGFYGDMALAFMLGWALRTVARGTAVCSTLSAGGIFRILCLAWCLNAETTLAVWLSSLYQACIAIFLPLYLYKSLLGD